MEEWLTSDLLEDLLHAATSLMTVLLLGINSRGRIQPSTGDVGAAAAAGEASQAAAAAAAGGRGHRSPPGTCRRPVGFHNLILGLKPRVISTPRLPRRRWRGANYSTDAKVLMLDVLHLYPLAWVESVRQPGRLTLRERLRSDPGWAHGPVRWIVQLVRTICRRSATYKT